MLDSRDEFLSRLFRIKALSGSNLFDVRPDGAEQENWEGGGRAENLGKHWFYPESKLDSSDNPARQPAVVSSNALMRPLARHFEVVQRVFCPGWRQAGAPRLRSHRNRPML